jgi:hypothetical protein
VADVAPVVPYVSTVLMDIPFVAVNITAICPQIAPIPVDIAHVLANVAALSGGCGLIAVLQVLMKFAAVTGDVVLVVPDITPILAGIDSVAAHVSTVLANIAAVVAQIAMIFAQVLPVLMLIVVLSESGGTQGQQRCCQQIGKMSSHVNSLLFELRAWEAALRILTPLCGLVAGFERRHDYL